MHDSPIGDRSILSKKKKVGDQCIALEYLERIDADGDAALDERLEFKTNPEAVVDYANTENVRAVGFDMEQTSPAVPVQLNLRSRRRAAEAFKLPVKVETEILDACCL